MWDTGKHQLLVQLEGGRDNKKVFPGWVSLVQVWVNERGRTPTQKKNAPQGRDIHQKRVPNAGYFLILANQTLVLPFGQNWRLTRLCLNRGQVRRIRGRGSTTKLRSIDFGQNFYWVTMVNTFLLA